MSGAPEPSGINALHDAVLAALPGSMQHICQHVGLEGRVVWDAVHTLRRAGIIVRLGPASARVFESVAAPALAAPAAPECASPGMLAAQAQKQERKTRKRVVILFFIPGWPSQEPNRRMVWTIAWSGRPRAEREVARLKKMFKKEVQWELASMSMLEIRRMRTKGYDLREIRDRE